jgi:hypothetical protein
MCVLCGEHNVPPTRELCVHCAFVVRAQVDDGLRKLEAYLAAWAAFERWCAGRRPG